MGTKMPQPPPGQGDKGLTGKPVGAGRAKNPPPPKTLPTPPPPPPPKKK